MKFNKEQLIELTRSDGGSHAVESLQDAYGFCMKLATSHYENFPVGSIIIPKKLRKHFYSIYAFARIADDIADELAEVDASTRVKLLNDFIGNLYEKDSGTAIIGNPVFVAIRSTINNFSLPPQPFERLITAFKMDVEFEQPTSFDDLEHYCIHSANPIGELVLRLFGEWNDDTSKKSDSICTALQLVNFWQDFSLDLPNGRCYLPTAMLEKYSLVKENLQDEKFSAILYPCLSEVYDKTSDYFAEGGQLIHRLKSNRLRMEIAATINGGKKMIDKIKESGAEIFHKRPSLSKSDYPGLLFKSVIDVMVRRRLGS